jgi:hypothetical protein
MSAVDICFFYKHIVHHLSSNSGAKELTLMILGQVLTQNFSFGGGGTKPEAIYSSVDFKHFVIKITS